MNKLPHMWYFLIREKIIIAITLFAWFTVLIILMRNLMYIFMNNDLLILLLLDIFQIKL